jgi:hypothetical protein
LEIARAPLVRGKGSKHLQRMHSDQTWGRQALVSSL